MSALKEKPVKKCKPPRTMNAAFQRMVKMAALNPLCSDSQLASEICRGSRISADSLRRRWQRHKKKQTDVVKRSGHHALTEDQERTMASVILAFAQSNTPLTLNQILAMASSVFDLNLSRHWLDGFLHRQKLYLALRQTKRIDIKRTTAAPIQEWLASHDSFTARFHFPAWARLNLDETMIRTSVGRRRVVAASSSQANNIEGRAATIGTYIPVVCADGSVFVSFIVLKRQPDNKIETPQWTERVSRRCWTRLWAVTDTGFINRKLYIDMLNEIKRRWTDVYPGLHALLYVDNCRTHRPSAAEALESNFVLQLASEGLHCFFFPANCTHWMQPLDNAAFGCFKRQLGAARAEKCFESAIFDQREGSLTVDDVIRAEKAAMKSSIIRRSWIATGMAKQGRPADIDHSTITSLAAQYQGEVLAAAPPELALAAAMASQVIGEVKSRSVRKPTKIRAALNTIFSTDDMRAAGEAEAKRAADTAAQKLRTAEKKSESRERKRRERDEREKSREEERARSENQKKQRQLLRIEQEKARWSRSHCAICSKPYRDGPVWWLCEYCEEYLVCNSHNSAQHLVEAHEAICQQPVQKDLDFDSQDESENES